MKKIMVSLVCAGSLFAFNDVYLNGLDTLPVAQIPITTTHYEMMPYAQYSNYSDSTNQDYGSIVGIYFSDMETNYKTEIDIKHRMLSYKNSSTINQDEISLFMNYFTNLAYKFGIHYIKSDDKLTDGGVIFSGGILDSINNYKLSTNLYYSYYSNLDTSPTFLQLSPKLGFVFGQSCALWHKFYVEIGVDYTKTLTHKDENQLKDNYTSTQLSFTAYNGKFTTSLGVWFGKRNFRVSDGGMMVENLDRNQKNGFKIAENYKIDNFSDITLGYTRNSFDNSNVVVNNFLVNYNYKF